MCEGKSETWFYYASQEASRLNIEYVMKCDTDSMIYFDRYFDFVSWSLPAASDTHPGASNDIIAGIPVGKTILNGWTIPGNEIPPEKEEPFRAHYGDAHFYASGQLYILSTNVAAGVALYASQHKDKQFQQYWEDHDISTLAFLHYVSDNNPLDRPIRFIFIRKDNPFWRHPIKISHGYDVWSSVWNDEINRMRQLIDNENGNSIRLNL